MGMRPCRIVLRVMRQVCWKHVRQTKVIRTCMHSPDANTTSVHNDITIGCRPETIVFRTEALTTSVRRVFRLQLPSAEDS